MTSIKLNVLGLGHVPSFKNKKRAILDRNTGKMRTLTEPEAAKWMQKCEDAFVSQLKSLYQTTEAVMPMVRSPRSWIACVAPYDDSVNIIREIHLTVHDAPKGCEGATITIEPL